MHTKAPDSAKNQSRGERCGSDGKEERTEGERENTTRSCQFCKQKSVYKTFNITHVVIWKLIQLNHNLFGSQPPQVPQNHFGCPDGG